ncbi:unnamed protein product [Didymodactylos carnosus]|uniref:Uncharacterized protein n=1 Tax=Didymodactylos carnosus TaxID=1234261 RepID=A0A815H8B8_9BILA|nr:unnamed protein product [Didymodactylos carnosus]CAF4216864.1 unnamed protein product [Didymodactylos carnosus]
MPSTSVPSTSVPSTSVPAQAHATAACTMGAFSNVFPAPIISTAAQTGDDLVGTYGVNLIINGDGETGPCETGGGTTHPSFWTYNGTITQVQYGNLQWADQNWTSPGPRGRADPAKEVDNDEVDKICECYLRLTALHEQLIKRVRVGYVKSDLPSFASI